VRSRWEKDTVARREQRPPRRYYGLTAAGEAKLVEARARFRALETLAPRMSRRWKPA
jgi:DNA-binding PadR family transcriptional regulator